MQFFTTAMTAKTEIPLHLFVAPYWLAAAGRVSDWSLSRPGRALLHNTTLSYTKLSALPHQTTRTDIINVTNLTIIICVIFFLNFCSKHMQFNKKTNYLAILGSLSYDYVGKMKARTISWTTSVELNKLNILT